MTIIEPKKISRPDRSHRLTKVIPGRSTVQGTSPYDCGFIQTGGAPYWVITMSWNVPDLSSRRGIFHPPTAYSSIWTGIDAFANLGQTDLLQAATEHDVTDLGGGNRAYAYYAWTEVLPIQVQQQITNFPVHPNDRIYVQVCKSDPTPAGSNCNLNGKYAAFEIINDATGQIARLLTDLEGTSVSSRLCNGFWNDHWLTDSYRILHLTPSIQPRNCR